jgi:pyruvate dehydrogenase E2 component (dihydrolipoamide acetyltransferase)
MATEVKLPRLGQGMESGTIVRWLKHEGEPVKKREPLYELDTDKVTQEVEAEADGVLLKIVVETGEVDVGTTVAFIGKEGEEVSVEAVTAKPAAAGPPPPPAAAGATSDTVSQGEAPARQGASAEEPTEEPTETATEEPVAGATVAPAEEPATPDTATKADGRVKASPLARRIARERGIDLATVTPTGPEGRIVAEDIETAAAAPAVAAPAAARPVETEVVQLTSVRRTIARRLTEAWAAPVFQLGVSAEMTEALALRERLVERLAEGDVKPTVNDVLVKLVAVALVRHPAVNAVFTGEEIHRVAQANVGIAVAAPGGLMVPVIRGAERSTVQEIARARADVVGRARDGKLTLQDFEDGTFTVSNLGMYGVEQFVAVLNPPQVAILAVGAVKDEAVVVDGEIDVAPIMHMTLTCDHRAIDGADGAEFLRTLVELIEAPALAL